MRRFLLSLIAVNLFTSMTPLEAEDWPEWRGEGRAGIWRESGILSTFPPDGLRVVWRTPVNTGFSGPAVADGRVFLTDFLEERQLQGMERAVALDEETGAILWTHEWPAAYASIMWPVGPRATPTVDSERVYVLGVNGKLFCLDVETGAVIWQKDYITDFDADPNTWAFNYGFTSAPVVHGDLLICMVGGQADGKVIALNKRTGQEVWRALSSDTELGAAQPLIVSAGGTRQLIIWYPGSVASLSPETGAVYWGTPLSRRRRSNGPDADPGRTVPVSDQLLQWSVDARARRLQTSRDTALERHEQQRAADRRHPLDDWRPGHRG